MNKRRRRADPRLRRATVNTVADDAGVSRQTVSNALNAPHRLRPETLLRVQQSIARLGYRPDAAARTLRTRSTRTIAYELTTAAEDRSVAYPYFLEALCRVANQHGYEVVTFAARERSGEVYDDLLRRHAADAFVLPAAQPFGTYDRSSPRRRVPFVVLGRPWIEGQRHSWIDVDDEAGVTKAVEHLVACKHRRIAFVGWPHDGARGDARYDGWLRGIRSHGLPVRGLSVRGEGTVEVAAELTSCLLRLRARPTAFVCVSDVAALGASLGIKNQQLRVGIDAAVVGFGDTDLTAATDPELTSLRPSFDAMAAGALQTLTKSLNARRMPRHSSVLIPPQLIVRASSQPIDAPADSAGVGRPSSR